jgi:hypothetical protein
MKEILQRISNFPDDYLEEIESVYFKCRSVENMSKWLANLNSASISIANGSLTYRQAETIIFELKVIHYLQGLNPKSQIIYEPPGLDQKGKSCDLLVCADRKYLIELKAFHPEQKYKSIPIEHITENNEVIMDGHSYHYYQSVRGHLIDETYEIEEKIDNYTREYITVMGLLLGFYLHVEDLRDFVTIYRTGKYRFDDPLGKMTMHNLDRKYRGNIDEFWGFPFFQTDFGFINGKSPFSVNINKRYDKEIVI